LRNQVSEQVIEECLAIYLDKITPNLALCESVNQLLELHDCCSQVAVRQFESSSLLGDENYVNSAKGRLIKVGLHFSPIKYACIVHAEMRLR
jgi:hypothetical protein